MYSVIISAELLILSQAKPEVTPARGEPIAIRLIWRSVPCLLYTVL